MPNNQIQRLLCGYDKENKSKPTLVVVDKGNGGYDELIQKFTPDELFYGVFKVEAVDDDSKRTKFILISWVGQKVRPMERAKMTSHIPKVSTFFRTHVEFQTSDLQEITKEDIIRKLNNSAGAHRPKEYNF